jgi:hypothetical protein
LEEPAGRLAVSPGGGVHVDDLPELVDRPVQPLPDTSPVQRSGQSAATISAVRARQSKPARTVRSIPRASSKAMTSRASVACSPLRNVEQDQQDFRCPAGGRSGSIGGNAASGFFAS